MNICTRQTRPTIAALLDELSEIHKSEAVEIETPIRQDRLNPMFELIDEMQANPEWKTMAELERL